MRVQESSIPLFERGIRRFDECMPSKAMCEIRYLWTRELQSRGIISILPVGTKLNYADYFTKIFGYHECINFLARLRLPLSKEFFAGEETIQSSAFPVADNVNLIGDEEDTGHLALLATL